MSANKTHVIESNYHTNAKRYDEGKLMLEFHGNTTTGTPVIHKVHLSWWMWTYIVREVSKQWVEERKSRLAEIVRIDQHVTKS